MIEHTPASPSGLAALDLCRGKLRAEQAVLETGVIEKPSQAAADGTRRHALTAWKVERLRMAGQPEWPDTVRLDDGTDVPVTEKDIEAVKIILPFYSDLPVIGKGVYGRDYWIEEKVLVGKGIQKLVGEPWPHVDLIEGTLDFGFAWGDTLGVVDNKFGYRPVDPENWQNKAYAIGLGLKVDWFGAHQRIARHGKIMLGILQPTVSPWKKAQEFPLQPTVSPWKKAQEFPVDSLQDWAHGIKEIVDDAMKPTAVRTPGEVQCRYCLAASTCEARMNAATRDVFEVLDVASPPIVAKDETSAIDETAPVDALAQMVELGPIADPGQISLEKLGKILDLAPFVEGFFNTARKEVAKRIKTEGIQAEKKSGWKLVNGQRTRAWSLTEGEREKKLRGIGLAVREIYPRKMATLAQLDAIAKSKSPRVVERLSNFWKWEKGKSILVPEGDERPSINAEMFEPTQEIDNELPDTEYRGWEEGKPISIPGPAQETDKDLPDISEWI